MNRQLRLILSVTAEDTISEAKSAWLGDIDETQITICTKRPIQFDRMNFECATVRILYGNRSNLVFFLNTLLAVQKERTDDGTQYRYVFAAPKEKVCNLKKYDLPVMTTKSVGYEKLLSMVKPKKKRKEVITA